MTAPLTIRVRAGGDEAGQVHALTVNAVAKSLHNSDLVIPLSARQSVPHATVRVDALGSDVAGKLEVVKAQIVEMERDLRNIGKDWERGLTLESRLVNLQAYALRLDAQLAALPTRSARRPAGIPGVYQVTIPSYTLIRPGEVGEQREAVRGELDTRHLDDGLRQRLHAYLLSGADMLPYWHCKTRHRMYATSRMPAADGALLRALTSHLLPCEQRLPPRDVVSLG